MADEVRAAVESARSAEATDTASHVAPETWIGACPGDGYEYDNQCARCGSSIAPEECDNCGGEGYSGHDCGEDCCCCADPDEDNIVCDWCGGRGSFWLCLSSDEWCQTHPRAGREHIASGTPEWFRIQREAPKG